MKISSCLLDCVVDADEHTKLANVDYSTDLRTIVTVGHMMRRHELEIGYHCEGCSGVILEGEEILELTNSDGETILLHQNAECAYQYVASDAYHKTARK